VECPRCKHRQVRPDAVECERCGVIFARLRPARRPPLQADPVPEATGPERAAIDAAGWRALGIGGTLAVASQVAPLLGVLVGMFVVLTHELGHAAAGWLFGRPSVPAFDFVYGGGVTLSLDPSKALLFGIYALFAGAAWVFRHNRTSLRLVLGLAAAHALLVATGGDHVAITALGHGGELFLAAFFLHRALSGRGCKLEAERPLYAWIGLHIVLHDVQFGWRLMTSAVARAEYGGAKGGGHWMDFDVLSQIFHVPLEGVAASFLAACLATPLVPLLGHLHRPRVERILGRLARVG
jgi:hypothetical protein